MSARQRARVALFKGVAITMEMIPEKVDRWLGESLAVTVGRLSSASRLHLRNNISRALGRGASTDLLERFVDRGFENYGRYWAEGAKLPAISPGVIKKHFCISEGEHYLAEAVASGRGVIVALPHIGSWEWGGAFLAQIGWPMTAVAEALEPPELFAFFKEKRESIGIGVEPLDDRAGTVLLTTLKEGRVVGLLCDRDIQGNGIPAILLGEEVTLPAGPATLALRTGAVLLAAACYAGPGDGHHAVILPPIDTTRSGKLREDVARVTQSVADDLSELIRRAPEQWHVLQPRFNEAS